jgi:magnesium chelatase family protein
MAKPKSYSFAFSGMVIRKSGSGFDLSIAIAILIVQEAFHKSHLLPWWYLANWHLMESSLCGGVLPALIAAYKSGVTRAIVPAANRSEAAL